jgi:PEGA domain
MSKGKIAVLAGLLLAAACASAAVRSVEIRIKILDSETHSQSLGGNNVPVNCDGVNFDAYCNHSKDSIVTNTLLVQEENGRTYHIVCTIETRYSRCVPLPKGGSYDARREKRGVTVYYVDDRGKARSQLYTVAPEDREAFAGTTTASAGQLGNAAGGSAKEGSAAEPVSGNAVETVKCIFSSTPSGADVVLDGRFVGSTPSVVGVTTGKHVVMISTPGFAQWRRELAVTPGSELTVNAVLEKAQ